MFSFNLTELSHREAENVHCVETLQVSYKLFQIFTDKCTLPLNQNPFLHVDMFLNTL